MSIAWVILAKIVSSREVRAVLSQGSGAASERLGPRGRGGLDTLYSSLYTPITGNQ
jgi:hypothetical protein